MSATKTIPAVVPVAPVALVAPVAPVALVALVAPVAPVAPGHRPTKAHKNPDFVLEMPENEDSEGQKSTKTSILCSKCPKTGVPDRKSAQKSRFCARKCQKWGSRRQKAHKNPDFVLGETGIGTGKRGIWHRETQPLPSCKSPRTLPKHKYLIIR